MPRTKQATVQVYCVCKQPYDETKGMIECSFCNEWFHPVCIKMTNIQFEYFSEEDREWFCEDCKETLTSNPSLTTAAAQVIAGEVAPDSGWSSEIYLESISEDQFSSLFVSQRIKKEGYALFFNGHVQVVQSNIDHGFLFFRGIVQASMKAQQYKVTVCIETEPFKINWTTCSCVAGIEGQCKHVVSLFYYIHHAIMTSCSHFPDQLASTDLLQTWNARTGVSDAAVLFSELHIQQPTIKQDKREVGINISNYKMNLDVSKYVNKASLEKLSSQLEFTQFPILEVWKSRDYTPVMRKEDQTQNYIQQLFELVKNSNFSYNYETEFETEIQQHQNFLKNQIFVNTEGAYKMCMETMCQSKSQLWKKKRLFLLTASNFKKICCMRDATDAAKTQMNINTYGFTSAALEHGKRFENTAIKAFLELPGIMDIIEWKSSVGLVINPLLPFLGASPDYLLCMKDGGGSEICLVEVKCPYNLFMTKTKIIDAAVKHKDFYFCKTGNSPIEVNKNHAVYYQVQGQLNICNVQSCYVVLFVPPHDLVYVKVKKNISFFNQEILPKLGRIWFHRLLPSFNPLA